MGQFEPFSWRGKKHRVISDDIAAAQGMHANLPSGAFAADPLAAVAYLERFLSPLDDNLGQARCRPARRIPFLAVMHFNDFRIEPRAENFRSLAREPEQGIDSHGKI